MKQSFSSYVIIYQKQLKEGNIQKAYIGLMKYVMGLKVHLSKISKDKFVFGNISFGYMDYTYFPFYNKYLREKSLRLGVVLNHREMRFELWLMGQNAETQQKYWEILKSSKWNENQTQMPKYSVLEVVLIENPNFDDLNALTKTIEKSVIRFSTEIITDLQEL